MKTIRDLKNIIFCFPNKGVGGISLLFLRLAERITTFTDAKIYVVDYRDGFMSNNIKNNKIEMLYYSDTEKLLLPDKSFLILQAITPWSLFPNLVIPSKTRILFWNCYPFNLIPVLPGLRKLIQSKYFFGIILLNSLLRSFKNEVKIFLKLLLQKKAIVFQDRENIIINEKYLGLNIDVASFLQISAGKSFHENKWNFAERKKTVLEFCWLGRICDFKYQILDFLLNQLNSNKVNCKFTIVGDGDYLNYLKERTSKYCFDVKYKKFCPQEELGDLLISKDILFAMGTSALEGAKFGVPTILLDVFNKKPPLNYQYKWIYRTIDYTLGFVEPVFSNKESNILTILSDYDKNKSNISDNCYNYYNENHDLDVVIKELFRFMQNSTFEMNDLTQVSTSFNRYIYNSFRKLRLLLS